MHAICVKRYALILNLFLARGRRKNSISCTGREKHLDEEHKDSALTIFFPPGKIIHHLIFIKATFLFYCSVLYGVFPNVPKVAWGSFIGRFAGSI